MPIKIKFDTWEGSDNEQIETFALWNGRYDIWEDISEGTKNSQIGILDLACAFPPSES